MTMRKAGMKVTTKTTFTMNNMTAVLRFANRLLSAVHDRRRVALPIFSSIDKMLSLHISGVDGRAFLTTVISQTDVVVGTMTSSILSDVLAEVVRRMSSALLSDVLAAVVKSVTSALLLRKTCCRTRAMFLPFCCCRLLRLTSTEW